LYAPQDRDGALADGHPRRRRVRHADDALAVPAPLRVAIAGFGAIGAVVARRLDQGMDGLVLAAVSARDRQAAEQRQAGFRKRVPVLALDELAERADIVVECAPAAVFREVAEPVLKAGRIFMPLSVGALLRHMD